MAFLQEHHKTALIWQDREIHYTALLSKVQRYASFFHIEPHEKVAIYSENRPEWVYALYAGWKNQGAVVPLDFMATPSEALYMLEDCQPRVLFYSQEKENDVKEIVSSLSFSITALKFEELPEDAADDTLLDFPERNADDTAVIIYTSGTTGSPKGVMLSFDNLLANIQSVSEDVAIFTPEQRIMVLLPTHHVYPLLGTIVIPLYTGGTCVFAASLAAKDMMHALQAHKVTVLLGVPRLFSLLRKNIREKIDQHVITRVLFRAAGMLGSRTISKIIFQKVHQQFGGHIRFLISGGAALDKDVAKDFLTLGFDVLTGFGMTEAAPMISFTRPGTLRLGSAGQLLPKNEVKIVDGEITAKGRNVMQGYYQRPEETAQVIKDGWLYTGDLGTVDEEGYIFITGRKKEIIVLPNGKNINPEEIESSILKSYDVVREIGVFMHENLLQAVIFPNFQVMQAKGVHQIEDHIRWDVIDPYNHSVSPAKKIMKFTVVKEELPKTRLGKLRRFQFPELTEKAAKPKPVQNEPTFPEYELIKQFLAQHTEHDIAPDDHIELDLGLDSLDKISFQTFLEGTFGVKVQDEEITKHFTVRAVAEYIQQKKVKMDLEGVNWHDILHKDVSVRLPQGSSTHGLVIGGIGWLSRMYFAISVQGLEHIPQSPVIFAPNHQSFIDGFLVNGNLPPAISKRTFFYADERHFRGKILEWLADKYNIIIMDINRKLKESLQKMAMALRHEKNIVIFPEGARTRDGKMTEFKKSFAILSAELNIPIIPVTIQGAYDAMPKGRHWPKFRQAISITFLPPVFPQGQDYDIITHTVYQRIQDNVKES